MSQFVRSRHVTGFRHGEYRYLYHDLFGYIIQMSQDVLSFLGFFDEPRAEAEAIDHFKRSYSERDVVRFIDVFEQYGCLTRPDTDERERMWSMFPVRGKWAVDRVADDGRVTLYWSEEGLARSRALEDWEAAFWTSLDGDTQLTVHLHNASAAGETDPGFKQRFLDFIAFLVHSSRQLLKLSEYPMGFYRQDRSSMPPYLISAMPYAREGAPARETDPNLERAERSFAALFSTPSPILDGLSYGQALHKALSEGHLLDPPPRRVLDLSMDFGAYLGDLAPLLPEDAELWVLARDEADQARYRARLSGMGERLHFLKGTPLALPKLGGPYDLILAQETLGALEHVPVEDYEPRGAGAARLARKYDLFPGDGPDGMLFNVGAVRLLEALEGAMGEGGRVMIIDYGEEYQPPTISTSSDDPYYLVQYEVLKVVARKLGFSTMYAFLIDFIPFDRDLYAISTNRSHFAALQAAFDDVGIPLEARPYTTREFAELKGEHTINPVMFEKVEDRCFSTVPNQLKVLMLSIPKAEGLEL
jgi:hypothetical protein